MQDGRSKETGMFVMKKNRKLFSILLFVGIVLWGILLWFGIFIYRMFFAKPIGTITGVENDRITIDGVIYDDDYNNDYSSSDRKDYLGKVETKDSEVVFRVYSVKGTDEYIYTLWGWEGAFYKRVDN